MISNSDDHIQPSPRSAVCLARKLPNQAESVFSNTDNAEDFIRRVPVAESTKTVSDLDYLSVGGRGIMDHDADPRVFVLRTCIFMQELMAIQQSDGPKNMGI